MRTPRQLPGLPRGHGRSFNRHTPVCRSPEPALQSAAPRSPSAIWRTTAQSWRVRRPSRPFAASASCTQHPPRGPASPNRTPLANTIRDPRSPSSSAYPRRPAPAEVRKRRQHGHSRPMTSVPGCHARLPPEQRPQRRAGAGPRTNRRAEKGPPSMYAPASHSKLERPRSTADARPTARTLARRSAVSAQRQLAFPPRTSAESCIRPCRADAQVPQSTAARSGPRPARSLSWVRGTISVASAHRRDHPARPAERGVHTRDDGCLVLRWCLACPGLRPRREVSISPCLRCWRRTGEVILHAPGADAPFSS